MPLSWVTSLSARSSLSWGLRKQKSGGPKVAPRRAKHLSCRAFHPVGPRADGCPWEGGREGRKEGGEGSWDRFSSRPLSSNPLWKPMRKASVASWEPSRKKAVKCCRGLPAVSACVRPSEMAPRPRANLLCAAFAQDLHWAEQDKTVVGVAQVTVPGQVQRHSSDFRKKTGSVDVVKSALQVHGQEAPFVVIVVFLEPLSNGVDDGFTAALGSELQSCWPEVPCQVFRGRCHQGFCCETSKSFSCRHGPVAAVLLFQGRDRSMNW